jgi:hypothetical protein
MAVIDDADIRFFGAMEDKQSCARELVLVMLEQLYISYGRLDKLDRAGPLLDQLTQIACTSGN